MPDITQKDVLLVGSRLAWLPGYGLQTVQSTVRDLTLHLQAAARMAYHADPRWADVRAVRRECESYDAARTAGCLSMGDQRWWDAHQPSYRDLERRITEECKAALAGAERAAWDMIHAARAERERRFSAHA